MGERTAYAPGTFSWVDLTTTDQVGAKDFYGGVFGWEANDLPTGDGFYSIMTVGGRSVAAIAPQPEPQRQAGVPPAWNSYIAVADADATAERAAALGGDVHAPPFDVFTAGRMAVIRDPQGAYFMIWQARDNVGAGIVNEPGALCWNELSSPDLDGSARFYGELFGWSLSPMEGGDSPYLVIMNGESSNGGMREPTPGSPPHWLPYFAVEDLDGVVAAAGEQGGSTLVEPQDIGIARIAVAADPQGAVFALYDGRLDP